MSVRQSLKRHFKIISLLQKKPMSFEEIQDEIAIDPNSVEEKLLTSQRTFQRDIQDIASIYGIEITSDKAGTTIIFRMIQKTRAHIDCGKTTIF